MNGPLYHRVDLRLVFVLCLLVWWKSDLLLQMIKSQLQTLKWRRKKNWPYNSNISVEFMVLNVKFRFHFTLISFPFRSDRIYQFVFFFELWHLLLTFLFVHTLTHIQWNYLSNGCIAIDWCGPLSLKWF